MSSPNVLMFAPAFAPSFFSEALVSSKLALAMLAKGWPVTVISGSSSAAVTYSDAWQFPWDGLAERVHAIAPNLETGGSSRSNLSHWGTLAQVRHPVSGAVWAREAADVALRLHRDRPFDLILTRSTSCYAHLPALILRRHFHLPWIANWNDPPGHLFPAPYSYPLPPLQRIFKNRYLRSSAQAADINTFPSDRLMHYLSRPLDLTDPARMAVVPHVGMGWIGRRATRNQGRFRICHAGNLSAERDPRSLLRAVAWALEKHSDVHIELDLIGKKTDEIMTELARISLNGNVIFNPGLPFADCFRRMEGADLLLLIEAPVDDGIFFPSKLVDYAEVGRPILAISPRNGVTRDLFDRYDLGAFAEIGSDVAITAALDHLINEWKADRPPPAGLAMLREYVAPSAIVQSIAGLLESVNRRDYARSPKAGLGVRGG